VIQASRISNDIPLRRDDVRDFSDFEGSEFVVQAEKVRCAIQNGLAALPDQETGRPAIRSVSRREELYSGPHVGESPDLLVNFCPGFRVSWQSSLGGFSHSLFENNTRRWSGDHIMDPDAVPGILFLNQPVVHNLAQIVDVLYGVQTLPMPVAVSNLHVRQRDKDTHTYDVDMTCMALGRNG